LPEQTTVENSDWKTEPDIKLSSGFQLQSEYKV